MQKCGQWLPLSHSFPHHTALTSPSRKSTLLESELSDLKSVLCHGCVTFAKCFTHPGLGFPNLSDGCSRPTQSAYRAKVTITQDHGLCKQETHKLTAHAASRRSPQWNTICRPGGQVRNSAVRKDVEINVWPRLKNQIFMEDFEFTTASDNTCVIRVLRDTELSL